MFIYNSFYFVVSLLLIISIASTLPVRNINGETITSEKMVPILIVEQKNKELAEKIEKIAVLTQKV
jgi:hypothetical protein